MQIILGPKLISWFLMFSAYFKYNFKYNIYYIYFLLKNFKYYKIEIYSIIYIYINININVNVL